jgi:hypothetical protein
MASLNQVENTNTAKISELKKYLIDLDRIRKTSHQKIFPDLVPILNVSEL